MASSLDSAKLFNVNGLVAVITGGGSGLVSSAICIFRYLASLLRIYAVIGHVHHLCKLESCLPLMSLVYQNAWLTSHTRDRRCL